MTLLLAGLLYLWLASPVQAALPIGCDAVRMYVRLFGPARAIAWARANGWTEKQIGEAKQCLR